MMTNIVFRGDFHGRASFPEVLNERKLLGMAIEIGTHRGDFAHALMDGTMGDGDVRVISGWKGKMLYCVDPWSTPEGYAQVLPQSNGDREKDLEEFKRRLDYYLIPHHFGDNRPDLPSRCSIMRMLSVQAATKFSGECLDFVYVDGDHRYEKVLEDFKAWWPKLRSGGMMAGHDFLAPNDIGYPGVQRAVNKFCDVVGITRVYLVPEHGLPWSFYVEKP